MAYTQKANRSRKHVFTMPFSKYNAAESPRLRALICIQLAAESLFSIYEHDTEPAARRECLQCAGELHKMAQKMKARFKVT